jgi:VWFA-related protein
MGSEGFARLHKGYARWIAVGLIAIVAGLNQRAVAQARPAAEGQPSQARPQEPGDPELSRRPPLKPQSPLIPEGKIKLDVVVDDGAGKAVAGLQPWDFKILDNNQPRKVLSFRAFNEAEVNPDPPVEVILVIDMVNLPFQEVAVTRQEIERFLQANGGHLRQPVTLLLLTDAGMRVQPRPSIDGNALVSVVSQIKGSVKTINAAMGGEGLLERFQLCARQIEAIAENEARKPGRKMLIWVGPGWPMLNRPELGYYSEKDQRRYFDGIVELSTRLREARVVVYSVAPATEADTTYAIRYQNYLKPVRSPRESDPGDLSLKVLATQTGGQILGPNNDVASQIERCITDANNFYRISFDPPAAEHEDEYHDLKVTVDRPGVTVRTNTGYYNEPAGH